MFRRGLRGFVSCFLLSFATFALLSLPAIAQTLGQITGRITDASGAAVTGADVTLVNIATNATRSTVTTGDGDYTFASIPPGTYNVKAQHAGFRVAAANHIEVQVQQTVRQDFSLAVGQVNESVQVSASADLLQTENLAVGTVIENKSVDRAAAERPQLPEPGRARAERQHALAVRRPGRIAPGRRPRRSVDLRRRPAHHVRQLHARRRQQHRSRTSTPTWCCPPSTRSRNSKCRPASIPPSSATSPRRSTC